MSEIKNRIVDHGVKPASEFCANPKNWRTHPMNQRAAVSSSLKELGWIDTVIVNRRTGYLVDGHERLWQALKKGDDTPVPFIEVDLSEEEEALALATLDPITGMATVDKQKLDELMQEISTGEEALNDMLSELAEDNGLEFGDSEEPPEDAGAEIDKAEELREKWGVETGQLWQLGEHRIICGDCTDEAVVDRLMGGEKADMVFTDPPYGVDYEGGAGNEKKREKLEGDSNGDLYGIGLMSLKSICKETAPMYVWFASSIGKPVYDAVEAIGYEVRAMIVWHKLKAHYGAFMAQYMQKHEPCLYIVNGNASWVGATNEVTVWEYDQPSVNEFHPTQKPIELAERSVSNHDAPIVADFFLGSGTTLIACERLNRKCRAIEISPAYVAVAIQRWADTTGKEPKLL